MFTNLSSSRVSMSAQSSSSSSSSDAPLDDSNLFGFNDMTHRAPTTAQASLNSSFDSGQLEGGNIDDMRDVDVIDEDAKATKANAHVITHPVSASLKAGAQLLKSASDEAVLPFMPLFGYWFKSEFSDGRPNNLREAWKETKLNTRNCVKKTTLWIKRKRAAIAFIVLIWAVWFVSSLTATRTIKTDIVRCHRELLSADGDVWRSGDVLCMKQDRSTDIVDYFNATIDWELTNKITLRKCKTVGIKATHCPSSSSYLGSGISHDQQLVAQDVKICWPIVVRFPNSTMEVSRPLSDNFIVGLMYPTMETFCMEPHERPLANLHFK